MRKVISTMLIGFVISTTQGQDISDALRYSQNNLNGTARFRAMAGAFGALGGDLSAMGVNPAGSSVFMNNQFGFSLTNYNKSNTSEYFGNKASDCDNNFTLNQIGGVFVFVNQDSNSKLNKITFGINYDNTNNFNNRTFSQGINPTTSGSQFFVNQANGIPEADFRNFGYSDFGFSGQQAFLAYQTHLINPIVANGNQYQSNMLGRDNFYQENTVLTSGHNGKLTFNLAAQYNDRIHFGINLNSHFVDYRRFTRFYEDTDDSQSVNAQGISTVTYENDLHTYGSGFSLQLGTIIRATKQLRLGLAYDSPTWYRLYDEFSQSMSTLEVLGPNRTQRHVENPGIINLYPLYKLRSPSRYTGSLAYIFGGSGLISLDYSLKDYGTTRFRPINDPVFREKNQEMSNILRVSSEVRVGIEYRIEQLSFRGGYWYDQSPYERGSIIGDLHGLSGGFGYNFGSVKFDMAYSYSQRTYNQPLFNAGLTDTVKTQTLSNNLTFSLLFEL